MTKLSKNDFDLGYGSERYIMYGEGAGRKSTFVARFKYKRAGACANHYVKELIRLLSKEEFEEAIVACLPGRAPASKVMNARGYVNYNLGKVAKSMGLTPQELNANPGLAFPNLA